MTDSLLSGSHVLVIGGTGKIGQAVVGHAASAGARVTLTSRDPERARSAAQAYDDLPVTGIGYDIADHGTVDALRDAAPFDHAVITASQNDFSSLTDIDADALKGLVETTLLGTMWTLRHLRPLLDAKGSITMISGMLSRRPTMAAPLGAVNAAIESLAVGLAHEYTPIRVNAISPGAIGDAGIGDHEGAPGDVAALITATMANRFINGTVLDIHGGI